MTRAARRLVGTVFMALVAVLSLPALIEAINTLSYDAKYGAYIQVVLDKLPLVLALLALVVLASYITEQ